MLIINLFYYIRLWWLNDFLTLQYAHSIEALTVVADELKQFKNITQQMERIEIKQMINNYSVGICLVISVILIVIAAQIYPGGSLFDKNSIGFGWSKNFLSNLFASTAINGSENPGRIWALIGMAFHAIGYGIFFMNMSKKIPSKKGAKILKYIGGANLLFIFLIATPLHDIGVISILLTLIGLFTITLFIFKSKLHLLKCCCISCLLTFYCFFFLFGFGYLGSAIIMQKVYNICAMLLVIGLEYFTKYEDFINSRPEEPKIQTTKR